MSNPNITRRLFIDIETLDTKPTAVITEIALVVFEEDFTPGPGIVFYPDNFEQLARGRTYSADTIAFRREQGTIYDQTPENVETIYSVIANIEHFIDNLAPFKDLYIWGKDFDGPFLDDFWRMENREFPIPFWKRRCARDAFYYAYGSSRKPRKKTHKALQDCHDSIADLKDAFEHFPAHNLLQTP